MGNLEKQRRNQEKKKKKIQHDAAVAAARQKQQHHANEKGGPHGVRNDSFFAPMMDSGNLPSSLSDSGDYNTSHPDQINPFNATAHHITRTSAVSLPSHLTVLATIAQFLPRTHEYNTLCRNSFMAMEGQTNGVFTPLKGYLGESLSALLPCLTTTDSNQGPNTGSGPKSSRCPGSMSVDPTLVETTLEPLSQDARNQAIFKLYRCGMSVLYRHHGHHHESHNHNQNFQLNRAAVNSVITTTINKGLFDVNTVDRSVGRHLLHYACRYGDTSLALSLIHSLGADPLQPERNKGKKTALHIAAGEGLEAVVFATFAPLKSLLSEKGKNGKKPSPGYVRALAAIPRLLDSNKRSVVDAASKGNHRSLGTQISGGIRSAQRLAAEAKEDDGDEEYDEGEEQDYDNDCWTEDADESGVEEKMLVESQSTPSGLSKSSADFVSSFDYCDRQPPVPTCLVTL